MKRKKGFTLIEIIVCIAILSIVSVGITITVLKINKNKLEKILENNSTKFQNALEVYLSTHEDVINNVKNNYKAGIVSLEVLKNDGLIKDNLNIDYKNEYFLLSNAILLDTPISDESECSNSTISVNYFSSWDLKNESSKVLYICPTNSGTSSGINLNDVKLENYTPKGNNPNNYVEYSYNDINYNYIILEINDGNTFLMGQSDNLKNMINESEINNFINPSSVEKTQYYKEKIIYNSDHADLRNLYTGIYSTYDSKIGKLNYSTFINSIGLDGSYYNNYYKDQTLCINAAVDAGWYEGIVYETNGRFSVEFDRKSTNLTKCDYYPIIKLNNSCASLKSKNNCGTDPIGSEACPYILDDSTC